MINIIHLPNRTDRRELLEQELAGQGIHEYQLWPGVTGIKPSLGIARAHQQIVRWAMKENLHDVTIAEDDIQFTASDAFKYFLKKKPPCFDLYLGGITYGQLDANNTVNDLAGTHLYIIQQNFYEEFLRQDGQIDIDRSLKGKGKFIVCNPMVAIQRNGFSDNRKRFMDYSTYFKNRQLYKGS